MAQHYFFEQVLLTERPWRKRFSRFKKWVSISLVILLLGGVFGYAIVNSDFIYRAEATLYLGAIVLNVIVWMLYLIPTHTVTGRALVSTLGIVLNYANRDKEVIKYTELEEVKILFNYDGTRVHRFRLGPKKYVYLKFKEVDDFRKYNILLKTLLKNKIRIHESTWKTLNAMESQRQDDY